MSSEKVMISPELSEIVRECSGEPNRMCLEENLRVGHQEEARPGGGVLFKGLRFEDGDRQHVDCRLFGDTPAGGLFEETPYGTVYCPGAACSVLAFDIETTGLSEADTVTCVCAFDAARGIDFRACTKRGEPCEEFLLLLDEAPLLCAFNGVLFDVKFMARRWNVPSERVAGWILKLLDPYQACKLALRRTFSLDKLLGANGMDCKTGSGKEAVEMARDGRWAELEDYCMSDTVKTHGLVAPGRMLLPQSTKR